MSAFRRLAGGPHRRNALIYARDEGPTIFGPANLATCGRIASTRHAVLRTSTRFDVGVCNKCEPSTGPSVASPTIGGTPAMAEPCECQSPVCPSPHRPSTLVRILPVSGSPGVRVTTEEWRPGVISRFLIHIGVLASVADSERYSRVDRELSYMAAMSRFRRHHQAHPVHARLSSEWDDLTAGWAVTSPSSGDSDHAVPANDTREALIG